MGLPRLSLQRKNNSERQVVMKGKGTLLRMLQVPGEDNHPTTRRQCLTLASCLSAAATLFLTDALVQNTRDRGQG